MPWKRRKHRNHRYNPGEDAISESMVQARRRLWIGIWIMIFLAVAIVGIFVLFWVVNKPVWSLHKLLPQSDAAY